MSVSNLKQIAEMYCENPTNITSLYINGKRYSKDEIIDIAKTYCKDEFCLEHKSTTNDTEKEDDTFISTMNISKDLFSNKLKDWTHGDPF